MKRSSSLLIICLVMLVAFFSGYRKDSLGENFSSVSSWIADQATSVVSLFSSEEPAAEEPKANEPKNSLSLPPPVKANNFMQAPPPTSAANFPPRPKARNPYEKMMGGQKNNPTLANTFKSFGKGKIDDKQKRKRNLYFEKLSEQMKKLKGEVPSIPPPVEVTPPIGNARETNSEPPVAIADPADTAIEADIENYELGAAELEAELDAADEVQEEENNDEELLADVLNELAE